MFTGIVKCIGKVREVHFPPEYSPGYVCDGSYTLVIGAAGSILDDAVPGDSIAVDGVCLTVVTIDSGREYFSAELCTETLSVTNLGYLKCGDQVNLERSLKLSEFLGGHIVQGHVDTTATIVKLEPYKAKDYLLTLELESSSSTQIMPLIAKKGYVSVSGISLTVSGIDPQKAWISFNIIPETWKRTNLRFKKVNDKLNIEVDCISKMVNTYVESALTSLNPTFKDNVEKLVSSHVEKLLSNHDSPLRSGVEKIVGNFLSKDP